MAYETLTSHRAMALDLVRNDAYAAALARVITPDSVVLDLGAGTGVLGLIAARLGAKRVYLVEPLDALVVAEEFVAANGLQNRVHCLRGRLDEVTIPERVDVIVSVMTGNFLLTEDLLPVLFQARDTYLKPGGHLIPDMAVMEAVPVSAPRVHATCVTDWSTPQHGVDLGAARAYAANTVFYGPAGLSDAAFLAQPAELLALDFHTAAYDALHAKVTFDIAASGPCDGFAGWFRMKLGERWLSTSPKAPQLHWSAAFLPVDPPLLFERGQALSLALDRLPHGDWTWRVRIGAEQRRHSTLLSMPLSPATLQKASRQYVPLRTEELAAVDFVLSCVDGVRDVTAVAALVSERFPQRYPSPQAALDFTQRVVAGF